METMMSRAPAVAAYPAGTDPAGRNLLELPAGAPAVAPDPSLDLFRRAICAGDDAARAALMAQYRRLVLAWVRQGGEVAMAEDDDYRVTRTFTRFWAAVGPERFDRFPGIPALLHYLKLCACCVLLDEIRGRKAVPRETFDWPGTGAARGEATRLAEPDGAAVVGDQLVGRDLWRAVVGVLHDDDERRVAYCSFVLGLAPREIVARYPSRFPDVSGVYRVECHVLERLQRSEHIRGWDA